MAAPREVPIILGIFVALAAMMGHFAAVRLDRASPRPEGPRVALLAPSARAPTSTDTLIMAGTGVVGLVGIAAQVLARRAWLLGATGESLPTEGTAREGPGTQTPGRLPPPERRMLARRAGLVFMLWAVFAALSLAFMLLRPPGERLLFIVPCALLLLPARVYVRYRDGEAAWAPWLLGLAVAVLGVTREPRFTWGLLLIAGGCQLCVLREEQVRRAKRQATASRDSRSAPSR